MSAHRVFPTGLTNFARRAGRGLICVTAFALPTLALNPDYRISQYAHSSWSSDAGLQAVRRIKQTPDGYLWLATRGGLVRFDGVRFSTFTAGSEEGLESSTAQDLLIDPDGSMWIATLGGGVAHYQAGKFRTYTVRDGLPSDDIGCLYRDSRGILWVGTRGAGIARMVHGRFEKLPLAIPASPITAFLDGTDHSLWIATFGYGVFRLQNGTLRSFTVKDGLPDNRIDTLYRDHAGRIWTAGWKGISFWNGIRFAAHPAVNAAVSYAISCTEDRDGNLWIGSSSGLFRAHAEEVSRIDRSTGLSGDFTSDIFEDREGNLWVGTRGGLDRFRDTQVRIFTQEDGSIRDPGPIVGNGRGVWTASNRQIGNIAADTIGAWPISLPPGSTTFTLSAEPEGGLLIGFDKGITQWKGARASIVSELSGLDVRSLLRARDGSIWIGTANRGLLRWRPSAGSRTISETGVTDKFITTLAEDRTGALWAGSDQGGGLYRLLRGNIQHFGRDEGLRSPDVYTVFVDGKGELWIGSTGGLSWFQDGHIRTVNSQQGLPADQVFAIQEDSYNRLWFTGFPGIAAIDKKSLADWATGRRRKVNPILYRTDERLQVRTTGNVFPNAARSSNGHLWFSIGEGLCEVTPPDPAAAHPSQFRIVIENVNIDGVPHSEPSRIQIPRGARSIELRYTALTLSDPETLRFRYRLEGFDNEWVDADTRRLAFYNNLKPGAYNFRVAASARGEEWQESPLLVLEQLPFFYQTWWFMLLASTAALSLAFFAYWLRVYQIAREFNVRLEERVSERTRLARDLHDTLLQSFQGLILRLQVVDELLPPGKAKEQLEKTLERADQAVAEGRNTVHDMRSSAAIMNDLPPALRALGEELATEDSATFHLVVEGPPRDLHPIIRDEVYRITREALRNAFAHARAHHIETEITYGERALRLRIRDDGQGIPPEILAEGRTGHYGLPGMRERARQIGGKLEIWSGAGAGTEIELSIAGSIAYAAPASRPLFRLFRQKAG
jgi:signal transduction histidine kinase/ligand-binding sensor domain-containing protein